MKIFLYWSCWAPYSGEQSAGLEEYDTIAEGEEHLRILQRDNPDNGFEWRFIRGEELVQLQSKMPSTIQADGA